MQGLTSLAVLAAALLSLAYVIRPLVARRARPERPPASLSAADLRRRATLLADRGRLYAAIRALDADHRAGKVSLALYRTRRRALVEEAVQVLIDLDALPDPGGDPIEAAVRAIRATPPGAREPAP
ncbi:MAG: hypothetical protein Kow00124_13980 [Anaerolineae bacterium]